MSWILRSWILRSLGEIHRTFHHKYNETLYEQMSSSKLRSWINWAKSVEIAYTCHSGQIQSTFQIWGIVQLLEIVSFSNRRKHRLESQEGPVKPRAGTCWVSRGNRGDILISCGWMLPECSPLWLLPVFYLSLWWLVFWGNQSCATVTAYGPLS